MEALNGRSLNPDSQFHLSIAINLRGSRKETVTLQVVAKGLFYDSLQVGIKCKNKKEVNMLEGKAELVIEEGGRTTNGM